MTDDLSIDEKKTLEIAQIIAEKYLNFKTPWQTAHEEEDRQVAKGIMKTLETQNTALSELKTDLQTSLERQQKYHEKSGPMLEWFEHMTWSKNNRLRQMKVAGMVIGIGTGSFAILAGLWSALKEFIHLFINNILK